MRDGGAPLLRLLGRPTRRFVYGLLAATWCILSGWRWGAVVGPPPSLSHVPCFPPRAAMRHDEVTIKSIHLVD